MSVTLRALVFVASTGLIYILLRVMPMGEAQRRFLTFVGILALFLVLSFGKYAKEAGIALLIFGMVGLLALDRNRSGKDS